MKRSIEYSSRFHFLPILGLIFITLKLVGHIDWPWYQVLWPLALDWILRIPEIRRDVLAVLRELEDCKKKSNGE